MASSQGQRSASSRGMPRLILAMLAGGWKLSASRKGQPNRSDNMRPVVLLPEPDTPISTIASGEVGSVMGCACPSLAGLEVPAETLAHGGEHLLGEGIALARPETGVEGRAQHLRRHRLLDRRLHGPAPFTR